MRADFDAELYLRLAGERMLIEGPDLNPGAPWQQMVEVAATLVAVGALDDEVARAVVEDYQTALSLRGKGVAHRPHRQAGPPVRLRPGRVAGCRPREIDVSWGTLQLDYVVLGHHATTLSATFTPPTVARRVVIPGTPPQPRITDDTGRSEVAHFDVGGQMQPGRSRLVTSSPLSPDTRWLEVDGTRVELVEAGPTPLVVIEPLPDADPAERYLRSRLTAGRHGPHGGPRPPFIEATIETLVAAGALSADSPVVHEAREVLKAFSGQPPAPTLGEPWSSLLRGPGPTTRSCTVLLGVVTPTFDDVAVSLEALIVRDGVAELSVEVTPITAFGSLHLPTSFHDTLLSWWGQDDRGQWYLGAPRGWSGQGDVAVGTIQLWPHLGPEARLLRLELSARRHRAIVPVALPAGGATA